MTLQELTRLAHAGHIEALNLLSLEGGLYLLEVETTAGGLSRLRDGDGRVLRLHSVEHARRLLEPVPELPFSLVHASAHDEMCGLPEGRREPLRVPIGMRSA